MTEPDVVPFRDFFPAFVEGNRVRLQVYPCHFEICDMYEAAVCGALPGYEYFVVNMPRRIGKTMILRALASWMLGEFGDAQMIYAGYSEMLVKASVRYIAQTLQKRWFRDIYGDLLHGGTRTSSRLITTLDGGLVYGTGTTGTAAGYGAGSKEPAGGFISLDDPANPTKTLSPVETENVRENFELTFKGCRNSDRFTPIFINAQRVGPDDLSGYCQSTYPTKTFSLKFPCYINGRSQFPDTWGDDTCTELQKTRIGRFVLASQYQQEPIALGGNLIPVDKFLRYDVRTARGMKFQRIVLTVDTALKVKEANDFSAAQAWGVLDRRAYLLDEVWGKWEAPELLTNIVAFYRKIQGDFPGVGLRLVVEEKAAGTSLLQNLRKQGTPAEGIERDLDKVRRIQNVLPHIESGLVYVPQPGSTPWIDGTINECAAFKPDMTHAHDDRVDCLADGIELTIGGPPDIFAALGLKPKR